MLKYQKNKKSKYKIQIILKKNKRCFILKLNFFQFFYFFSKIDSNKYILLLSIVAKLSYVPYR